MVYNLVKIGLVSLILLLAGCADSFDPADAYQDLTAKEFKNSNVFPLNFGELSPSFKVCGHAESLSRKPFTSRD